jgi:carboxyl-terminal processing protease
MHRVVASSVPGRSSGRAAWFAKKLRRAPHRQQILLAVSVTKLLGIVRFCPVFADPSAKRVAVLAGLALFLGAAEPRAIAPPATVFGFRLSASVVRLGEPIDAEVAVAPKGVVWPTGELPRLGCDEARRITRQARTLQAVPAEPVVAERFASATADWLDPHGFWSMASDAPVARAIEEQREALLQELEAPPRSGPCTAAISIGRSLRDWVTDLRVGLVKSRDLASRQPMQPRTWWSAIDSSPFEDGDARRRAQDTVRLIGHGLGTAETSLGGALRPYADDAVRRLTPELDAEGWGDVLLAAAVRAYLPQIDPHGAWAPLDEESSIYDLELEIDPPVRLWGDMTRTAIGARMDRDPLPPLKEGDVVLSIGGVSVAGLSIEQANQLGLFHDEPREVLFLREGRDQIERAAVARPSLERAAGDEIAADLPSELVGFGDGAVLVLRIADVPDDLGDRILTTIAAVEAPLGILLDLRGNGGGSTDGALAALGIFLPGAPLFPLRRRDGSIEVDRAPRLGDADRWHGPVAALVDGDSASAAEMIAGALAAYSRGPVLGARTYGKGCAQEYLDDEVGRGVLRLTTLLFCLPDGAPLQQVGVSPDISLGLPSGVERESNLAQAPASWSGPDVRDPSMVTPRPWPEHGGRVGAAHDPTIYRALRALGAARAARR